MLRHLTPTVIEIALGLRALWKAPDWGMKVVSLVDAIRWSRKNGP
jgi:hypothetical protein